MPHMKYFQAIGRIKDRYETIMDHFERKDDAASYFLDIQGIRPSDKALLQEEIDVLDYIMGCQLGFAYEKNLSKPRIEVVNRCFNRQLDRLELVFGIDAYNVNKHPRKQIRKQYKACRHYLFQFSQNGWYRNMPDEILTIENKYPDHNLSH